MAAFEYGLCCVAFVSCIGVRKGGGGGGLRGFKPSPKVLASGAKHPLVPLS